MPLRPLRVLHVIESLGTGGMENGVVNLVNRHDPTVVSAAVLCIRELGGFAGRIPGNKLYFDQAVGESIMRAARKVSETCRANDFDIVHSHSWCTLVPSFYGTRVSRTPYFVHGEHGTLFLDSYKRRLIQRLIFNRADRCLSVSNALMREITQTLAIPESKFSVIGNGVDTEKYRPNDESRRQLANMLGCDDDTLIIGSVGRLVPVKDYPTMLRAFAKLREETARSCRLAVIGEGQQRQELQSIANELGIARETHFLGEVDTAAQLIPGLDIFVLPSVHEGMSNTLLESASSGVVAVASDIPPNREVIIDGKTGLFFDVGDADALCRQLACLAEEPDRRKELSAASRRHAFDKLSFDQMIRNYESVYCSLIDQPESMLAGQAS